MYELVLLQGERVAVVERSWSLGQTFWAMGAVTFDAEVAMTVDVLFLPAEVLKVDALLVVAEMGADERLVDVFASS